MKKLDEINKAVEMIYTKDDCGAFCPLHIPLIEMGETGVGRAEFLRREPLPFPVDCQMCKALEALEPTQERRGSSES